MAFTEEAGGVVGNPREDLVVHMFSRLTDLDNFWVVLATLSPKGQRSIGRRLGWLNVLSPHHPDR